MQRVSLKAKILQPHSIISKQELFEQYNSLQLCLKNKENKKGKANISVGNN